MFSGCGRDGHKAVFLVRGFQNSGVSLFEHVDLTVLLRSSDAPM